MNADSFIASIKQMLENEKNKYKKKGSKLSEANDLYNSLVEKGLIKPRGYTLRGIEDMHLLRHRPNVPRKK